MSGTITDVSGKTYNIEDVDKITWVDYNGDVLFESNYGDTVTYVQNGVEKTKTLTDSRRLLKFMDGFVEGDYSYMPKTTADVVQAASLNMMTDSSLWLIAKGAVTLGGALIGSLAGNPLLGASIGTMVANLGADAYQFAKSYGEDPNTFWSRYIENLKAVSTGVDSDQEAEATGFQRWMSELNTGMSYMGIGGKEAVYETWDDIIGATPDYVSANILGNLVRSIASSLTSTPGFSPTYVVDQLFNDGIREAARIEGITNDNVEAAKMGVVYGALSGVTAGFSAKLPLMQIPLVKRMDEVSPFLGSPIANGIEAASAQLAYDFIQNVADDTVPDKTVADVGINAGIAFGLGWAMSALPVMFSKLRPGQVALDAQAPSTGDQPTVKEVVENKIVVENADAELARMYEMPQIDFRGTDLEHGKYTVKKMAEPPSLPHKKRYEKLFYPDGTEIGDFLIDVETGKVDYEALDWLKSLGFVARTPQREQGSALGAIEKYQKAYEKYSKAVEAGNADKIVLGGKFQNEKGEDITPREWFKRIKAEAQEEIPKEMAAKEFQEKKVKAAQLAKELQEREDLLVKKRTADAEQEAAELEFAKLSEIYAYGATPAAKTKRKKQKELPRFESAQPPETYRVYDNSGNVVFETQVTKGTDGELVETKLAESQRKFQKDLQAIQRAYELRAEEAADFASAVSAVRAYKKEQYLERMNTHERDIMNALGYGALGDEFLITAQKQMKTDAIEAAYKGLRPNQRETFAKRMGYDSFDAFVESTPITELLDLNKEIVKIYDIPVYDPNVFAVSPQARAEIKKEAVRLANSGVSPEIAVYLSFCKKTRSAPSQGQIQEIVSELPNKISMLGETKSKAEELIRFMDGRGQAYLKDESLLEFKYPDNIDVTETVSAARTLEPLSPVKEKKTRAKRTEKK